MRLQNARDVLSNEQACQDHEDPQVSGIEPVEEVLGPARIPPALAVVQQDKRDHGDHHPLAVEAQGAHKRDAGRARARLGT